MDIQKSACHPASSRYPFAYDPTRSYLLQVREWVADVFYDRLPDCGFEVREEQIYMAYQLERAFRGKETLFAEAGVGTGKTMAYLLYSLCYARYMRKPVVIACADESLIEQLVKPEGDIAKLRRYLNLDIDARLAKSHDQYLCLNKLDDARFMSAEAELFEELHETLPDFVRSRMSMQPFHAYGDRKHYPHFTDEQWNEISWDVFQDCFICDKRQRCGQTLSRDHYRKAADLVVCSHDFYMEHIWTGESRKREGQLPLLPDHCAVVFDEGHLLEAAAQKALTYKLKHSVFLELLQRLLQGQIRESLALLIEQAIAQSETMFGVLERQSMAVLGSDRKRIQWDDGLKREIGRFRHIVVEIEEELVLESGLYTLNEYHLRIVEEHLEMLQKALGLFDRPEPPLCWVAEGEEREPVLAIMPRKVKEVMQENVFEQSMPIIFSSATLSVDGSFKYVAESIGVSRYLSFTVPSPFDYGSQMEVVAPRWADEGTFAEKMNAAVYWLKRTEGRALILFRTNESLLRFKQEAVRHPECAGMRFGFEGDRELSDLVASFQSGERGVLCAVRLWEGLDVPGPSLSNVIIWSLPFPPHDPVYEAKRSECDDPFAEVDLPFMLLRLRQGIGRLIRTRYDSGIVVLLGEQMHDGSGILASVQSILPPGVALKI
ncbi:ATP-dependent DNA helicase [Paenibacillus allorhizosphaerae]|uniref:ATP-dependent DNA helicase YoaA n=1 Tax=Paenibacillus allorhizosphaerae TaxID=2849866 RepID=A0ABM8VFV5_9BACL|nr:ATP-dependent DNA helicase [Paenibacillus allorhizosphaerae]CAG7636100.1 putative ATP-dependent DNA helicase YoaA [Paenibacillus allorhizosphaerae]